MRVFGPGPRTPGVSKRCLMLSKGQRSRAQKHSFSRSSNEPLKLQNPPPHFRPRAVDPRKREVLIRLLRPRRARAPRGGFVPWLWDGKMIKKSNFPKNDVSSQNCITTLLNTLKTHNNTCHCISVPFGHLGPHSNTYRRTETQKTQKS